MKVKELISLLQAQDPDMVVLLEAHNRECFHNTHAVKVKKIDEDLLEENDDGETYVVLS